MPEIGAPTGGGGGTFTGGEISEGILYYGFSNGNDIAFDTKKAGQDHYAFRVSCNGALYWSDGVNPADSYIFRKSVSRLYCNSKFIAGALGADNLAAASILGTVTGKMEVFDSLGNSQGFIGIYDAIT